MKQSTKDRAAGKLHEAKGAIKAAVGALTNDGKLETAGKIERATGKAQGVVGRVEKAVGK